MQPLTQRKKTHIREFMGQLENSADDLALFDRSYPTKLRSMLEANHFGVSVTHPDMIPPFFQDNHFPGPDQFIDRQRAVLYDFNNTRDYLDQQKEDIQERRNYLNTEDPTDSMGFQKRLDEHDSAVANRQQELNMAEYSYPWGGPTKNLTLLEHRAPQLAQVVGARDTLLSLQTPREGFQNYVHPSAMYGRDGQLNTYGAANKLMEMNFDAKAAQPMPETFGEI